MERSSLLFFIHIVKKKHVEGKDAIFFFKRIIFFTHLCHTYFIPKQNLDKASCYVFAFSGNNDFFFSPRTHFYL